MYNITALFALLLTVFVSYSFKTTYFASLE